MTHPKSCVCDAIKVFILVHNDQENQGAIARMAM